MKVVTSPEAPPKISMMNGIFESYVFLAGSIEQGQAVNWQQTVIDEMGDYNSLTIFNPRRKDWDPTWDQNPKNEQLKEQILWELKYMDKADVVFFFFAAGTLSPVSMLELGLQLSRGTTCVVVCEPGYLRAANVHVTCEKYGQLVYTSLKKGISVLKEFVIDYA